MCYNIVTVKDRTQKLRKRLIFMMSVFEEMFAQVQDMYDEEWWQVFDGPHFEEVESLIVDALGADALDSPEFDAWVSEMSEDL